MQECGRISQACIFRVLGVPCVLWRLTDGTQTCFYPNASVGVAESVAKVAALLAGVEWLDVDYGGGALRRLREGIQNLRVVHEVRSGLMFETEYLLRRFDMLVRAEKERAELLLSNFALARGFKVAAAARIEVRLKLGSARTELELSRVGLAGV